MTSIDFAKCIFVVACASVAIFATSCIIDPIDGDEIPSDTDKKTCKEDQYVTGIAGDQCMNCPHKITCYQLLDHPKIYSFTPDNFSVKFQLGKLGMPLTKVTYIAEIYAARKRDRLPSETGRGRAPSKLEDDHGNPLYSRVEKRGEATIFADGTTEISLRKDDIQRYIIQGYNIFEVKIKELSFESKCKNSNTKMYQAGIVWYLDEFGDNSHEDNTSCRDL